MKNLLCHTNYVNFLLLLQLSLCISFSACEIGTNQRSNSLSFSSKSLLSTQNSSGVGPDDAVIIVDHGSNRNEANLMLDKFVKMFRNKTGYKIVEPAHMVFEAETTLTRHNYDLDIVNDRINGCLKHGPGGAEECSVCDGTGKCILNQEA